METNLRELRAVQKMNRAERKAMADSRAMEEQMERENPLSGSGATPSMGLSQVRGGKKMMKNAAAQGKQLMEHLEALHGSGYAKEFHRGMCGDGYGKKQKKHKKKHDSETESESDSESDEECKGGLHTGRYEGEGAKFSRDTQDFSGHMKGGFWGLASGLASIGIPLIANLLGKGKMTQEAHDQVKNMIENKIAKKMEEHEKKHHSGMKGGFWGLAAMALPLISKLLGAGKMTQDAHDKLEKMFMKSDKEMKGAGRVVGGMMMSDLLRTPIMNANPMKIFPSPAYRGRVPVMEAMQPVMQGMGKVKRVVGAGDPRRKRAEIVKKVMAEKGLSMVDASKYVKANNLYKKD